MLTLKETIAELQKLGHMPNKSFGQNFLVDKNIVEISVKLANLSAQDHVIEIGPGLGTLTSAILATGVKLTSIERDKHLLPYLRETFSEQIESGQFTIINEDATKVDYGRFNQSPSAPGKEHRNQGLISMQPTGGCGSVSDNENQKPDTYPHGSQGAAPLTTPPPALSAVALAKEEGRGSEGGFKILANLPYAIATPLLEKFLLGQPTSMTLMLQRELAERWAATSGKQFSAISIFLQSAYTGGIAHSVGRKCFFPPPAVDSVLAHYNLKENPVIFSPDRQKLIRFLFLNRRKQLHKAAEMSPVSTAWFATLADEGKIKSTARAEEIPVNLWQKLAT